MFEVKGRPFVSAIDGLRDAQDLIERNPSWLKKDNLSTWFDALVPELQNLGCRQTIKKIESVRFLFEKDHQHKEGVDPTILASSFNRQMSEVWSRLKDEIEDQKIFCITEREAEALGPVGIVFGLDVETKFNEVIFDLEEASKAIAFSRGTAGVFHLMRAMEAVVSRVGDSLGAGVVDKDNVGLEWGKIIANMKAPIEAKPKGNERDEWSEVLSLLYHVKQAWRNTTMHPKQTYTLEEASEVLVAVKSFLRRLAPLI